MKHLTLCFLIKRNNQNIPTQICLAMKKRGFGEGKYNGYGGKVEEGETIEQAVARETMEEIGVEIIDPKKVGELVFSYLDIDITSKAYIYFCETWNNDPIETEEMNPEWFNIETIPYEQMWVDDIHWLPQVLDGKLISGKIIFIDQKTIHQKSIEIVEQFDE